MTEYLTEQEQVQQLKTWLKQYGPPLILGILLACVTTTGWHYWQSYRNKILTHASAVYDEMLALRVQGNESGMLVQAQKIFTHYARTPYATLAALMLARDAVTKKNYPEAMSHFKWVVDHSKDPGLREIARLRSARVLIAQQKPQEALALLQNCTDKNFIGLVEEIRGDALVALHNPVDAKKAYTLALQEIPHADVTRPLLQMKLDNLAG